MFVNGQQAFGFGALTRLFGTFSHDITLQLNEWFQQHSATTMGAQNDPALYQKRPGLRKNPG